MTDNNDPKDPRAGIFQPHSLDKGIMNEGTATSHGGTYAGARWVDGNLVSGNFSKTLQGSSHAVVAEADAAQGVPYAAAYHHITRDRITSDKVTDDTILDFAGRGQVTARDARMMGWFGGGTRPFADSPQQGALQEQRQQPEQQPKEEVHTDLEFDLLADEALDRDYSSLLDTTGGIEQQAAISQVIKTGAIEARTLGTLATQLQCEPEVLAARVSPIMAAFEAQARQVMGAGGLDSNDVVAYAQQNCPDKLNEAMTRQANMRQTVGYAAIRQAYLENLATHNPSAALNADLGNGITQYQDNKGRVMVRIPGMGEMLWNTAIKSFGPR